MKDINMLEISRKIDENDVDIWKKQIINHAKEYVKKHGFSSYKDAILTLLKIMEETRKKFQTKNWDSYRLPLFCCCVCATLTKRGSRRNES